MGCEGGRRREEPGPRSAGSRWWCPTRQHSRVLSKLILRYAPELALLAQDDVAVALSNDHETKVLAKKRLLMHSFPDVFLSVGSFRHLESRQDGTR